MQTRRRKKQIREQKDERRVVWRFLNTRDDFDPSLYHSEPQFPRRALLKAYNDFALPIEGLDAPVDSLTDAAASIKEWRRPDLDFPQGARRPSKR